MVIAPHGDERTKLGSVLAEQGLERHVALTVSHFLVAPFIVAESDLILTVSARVAKVMWRKLGLITRPCPAAPAAYDLTMVWRAGAELDPGATGCGPRSNARRSERSPLLRGRSPGVAK